VDQLCILARIPDYAFLDDRFLGPKRYWIIAFSSALVGMLLSSSKLFLFSNKALNTLTASPTRMNIIQVSQVSATKSLGVITDDKLDWLSHIDQINEKDRLWYRGP